MDDYTPSGEPEQETPKIGKYEIDMCTGAILPKLLLFALPLMASSLLQLMFNAADIVVVGMFCGDASMAAVGSNGSMVNLLTNFFIGLSVGTNVLAARYFGSKNKEELSKTVHTSMLIGLISGIFITFIGFFGARQILEWMKTPSDVIDLATVYLKIYFLGTTATTVYNFGSALLRSIGDTKRPLIFLFVSGMLDAILNVLFVAVFKLDVVGAAITTVMTQFLSAFLIVRCLIRETGGIHLDLKKLRFDWEKFRQIAAIGLPAGLQGTLFSLSNVVIQSSINLFGKNVVAGNTAASTLEGFVYVSMNAFYQSVISFTSQNFGRRNYKRIVHAQLWGQLCVIIAGLVLGNLLTFFGRGLMSIFTDVPEVVNAGIVRFDYIARLYFLCGMMDCLVGSLRGIGYSFAPMIVSLIGACGLRLVWIATVFQIPAYHTIETVYVSYPISWIVTAAAHAVIFVILLRRVKRKFPPLEDSTDFIR